MKRFSLLILPLFLCLTVVAQRAPHSNYGLTPAETASPEAAIQAFYATLSGEPGSRNWKKLKALCLPDAPFNAVRYKNGKRVVKTGTVSDYIVNTDGFFKKNGFFQQDRANVSFRYDRVAQLFSHYTAVFEYPATQKRVEEDGMACFQLILKEDRWWISSITWNAGNGIDPVRLPDGQAATPGATATPSTPAPQIIEAPIIRYEAGVEGMIYDEKEVDKAPVFPQGDAAIFQHLAENMAVPANPAEAAMSGTFTVEFVVDNRGFVTNVKSADAPGPGWYEETVQALVSMPEWTPGQKGGQAVNTRIRLKISYGKK